ncbi:Major facilitator superfamily domain containing protein [Elaphomyces granulatus]|jgi:MFS family permease
MEFNKPSSPIPGEHDEEKAPQLQEQESTNLDKNGLRVDGDDEDHSHETPMTFRRFMSFIALSMLLSGSQIPLYLFAGIAPYVYSDIGGTDIYVWFAVANLLALAAICPFVGYLSDLLGRRYVAIAGSSLICAGAAVSSTAKSMIVFIIGMTFSGAGAGICELTAVAATSELAPTRKRGTYVALLNLSIIFFIPSVLWGQLITNYSNWRYVGIVIGGWNGLGLLITYLFYFPPPRINSKGLSKSEIISRIDYLGGFLSVSGMTLVLVAIQMGGYQYKWTSPQVLVLLLLGLFVLTLFVLWELYGAKYPIVPTRLGAEPLILSLTFLITFISGANFYSVVMFWPSETFDVYGHDPIQVGVRCLPFAFGLVFGAIATLWLLSYLQGRTRELMVACCCLMTIGCGALSIARPDNLNQVLAITLADGIGIGGILILPSVISTIICPDDLIATVTALTLSIRVLGGCIGYAIYYNVYVNKFTANAIYYIGGAMKLELNITNATYIEEAIGLTSLSLLDDLQQIPGIAGNQTAYDIVVQAGQIAFSESLKWVYLTSIAFGMVAIIAACAMKNIKKYMDDHVAVVMH